MLLRRAELDAPAGPRQTLTCRGTKLIGTSPSMSTSDSDAPPGPPPILPVGDRQLERIAPDKVLTVRVQPVPGPADPHSARVLDLSLHGLLLTAIPSLAQDSLVDILDLEPNAVRARVVRQSNLGTHVSFIDHLHPRYRKSRPAGPSGATGGMRGLISALLARLGFGRSD